jgi:putative DNA primase/helicase
MGKGGVPVAPANSEEYLALTFIDRHEADLRFVSKWGQWLRWDGSRWESEETLHAFDMARLICREAANACNKASVAKTLASAKTVAAVERLVKADRKLAATFEQWDTDFNKFNACEED